MASVDGDDLLVQLYDAVRHEPLGNVVRIDGQGRDPRIGEAANHIWNCLYNYNYKKRELEEHILREAAERFLSSTAQEVNDVLRMSDGTMQDYMLRRTELDMSAASTASRMVLYQLGNELARMVCRHNNAAWCWPDGLPQTTLRVCLPKAAGPCPLPR